MPRILLARPSVDICHHVQTLVTCQQTVLVAMPVLVLCLIDGKEPLRIGRDGCCGGPLHVVIILGALQLHLLAGNRLPGHIIHHVALHTVVGLRHQHKRPCRHREIPHDEPLGCKILGGGSHQHIMTRGKLGDIGIMLVELIIPRQLKLLAPRAHHCFFQQFVSFIGIALIIFCEPFGILDHAVEKMLRVAGPHPCQQVAACGRHLVNRQLNHRSQNAASAVGAAHAALALRPAGNGAVAIGYRSQIVSVSHTVASQLLIKQSQLLVARPAVAVQAFLRHPFAVGGGLIGLVGEIV